MSDWQLAHTCPVFQVVLLYLPDKPVYESIVVGLRRRHDNGEEYGNYIFNSLDREITQGVKNALQERT